MSTAMSEEDKFEKILFILERMTKEELKKFEELYRQRFNIQSQDKRYLDEITA